MITDRDIACILGPYAAETPEAIAENVRRASVLARHICRLGWAPIVPHLHGHAGVHGSPTEDDGSARVVALQCSRSHVRAAKGLFVILRDDGEMSPGTAKEVTWFLEKGGSEGQLFKHTWTDWVEQMESSGPIAEEIERYMVSLDADPGAQLTPGLAAMRALSSES